MASTPASAGPKNIFIVGPSLCCAVDSDSAAEAAVWMVVVVLREPDPLSVDSDSAAEAAVWMVVAVVLREPDPESLVEWLATRFCATESAMAVGVSEPEPEVLLE
ncbi:hypothetical protein PHMEG_00012631 [Phytophthora megakarya]|uniref:Uncharacterized protein n=1 Tax=Phytophthora megakarya TaxID=4795 RepID=A0A225W886_9STRA|nr:hypothetical protein PHMEG_00012631 [Phytophthora megakarya]